MRTGVAPASGRWANAGGPGNPGVDSGLLAARLGGLSRPAPTSDANTAADGTPVTAELGGTVFKIFSAAYTGTRTERAPGTVLAADKDGIEVACAGGETLLVTSLQAPGGKRMAVGDYLRGHTIPAEG